MRQIFLDTETTGLEPQDGHRVIEIGCVEMINRRLTGNHFHQYLNPERAIDPGAREVHGLSSEFLADKPLFRDVADDFLAFITDAEIIIHNAPFDVGFLESELALMEHATRQLRDVCRIADSLTLAREMHPGQKNNLDALCRRYEVDNSSRELHGALLDAEILADVYLAMTGGQADLMFDRREQGDKGENGGNRRLQQVQTGLSVIAATEAEMELHLQRLQAIDKASKGLCLWREDLPKATDQA